MASLVFSSQFQGIQVHIIQSHGFILSWQNMLIKLLVFFLLTLSSACSTLENLKQESSEGVKNESLQYPVEKTAEEPELIEERKASETPGKEKDKENIPEAIKNIEASAIQSAKEDKQQKQQKQEETLALPKASLFGKIVLLDSQGQQVSSEGTLLELIPETVSGKADTTMASESHVVDTKSKTYVPGFMTVNVGDTLVFKNSDPIKHNVFSSSRNNTFDLGTYGFNRIEKYQVKNEGIIKVYCNIHREMALFIAASKGNPSMVANKEGEYIFKGLESGRYTLKAWHPRGEAEIPVQIHSGKVQKDIEIDTSSYTPEPRVNKHGEPYKKKPALFEDEFY